MYQTTLSEYNSPIQIMQIESTRPATVIYLYHFFQIASCLFAPKKNRMGKFLLSKS